jgi:hypothetical protein
LQVRQAAVAGVDVCPRMGGIQLAKFRRELTEAFRLWGANRYTHMEVAELGSPSEMTSARKYNQPAR